MELRDIEIFLTLAEELHFGRTADRLLVSRARVSQAIQQTERQIGAPLFERTSRKVTLTPIGAQLRDDLGAGYDQIQQGIKRAQAAARGLSGRLRLGVMDAMGHEIQDVIDAFKARYPECELQIREVVFGDPFGPLRNGKIDLQVIWLPVDEPDFTVGPVVLVEPMVLAVSSRHPLARRESVSLEDIADGPVFQPAAPVPAYWEEAINPRQTPSGRPIRRGPVSGTATETLTQIGMGLGMSPVPLHAVKYFARDDIAYVPLVDAAPLRWGLIWRTAGETSLVRAFAEIAADQRSTFVEEPQGH